MASQHSGPLAIGNSTGLSTSAEPEADDKPFPVQNQANFSYPWMKKTQIK
jgi:hypothetical protein